MYRFFVDKEKTTGDTIVIDGGDYNHIKNVLRMKIGDDILISDKEEREYQCTITEFTKDTVVTKIVDVFATESELNTKIYLFQGLPKADKMELIIQKAVELGVYEIIPVNTKRTVVKLDAKKEEKKIERWNAIANSAAKQSKRQIIPKVSKVLALEKALELASELEMVMVPYENAKGMSHAKATIKEATGKKSIGIFIGPEGGFEENEIRKAMETGAIPISLGKRILRTETAGMAILSILMFEMEAEGK